MDLTQGTSEEKNLLLLLNSDKFNQIITKIMSDEAAEYAKMLHQTAQKDVDINQSELSDEEESGRSLEIYKWVDDKGQIHYSDKKKDDTHE